MNEMTQNEKDAVREYSARDPEWLNHVFLALAERTDGFAPHLRTQDTMNTYSGVNYELKWQVRSDLMLGVMVQPHGFIDSKAQIDEDDLRECCRELAQMKIPFEHWSISDVNSLNKHAITIKHIAELFGLERLHLKRLIEQVKNSNENPIFDYEPFKARCDEVFQYIAKEQDKWEREAPLRENEEREMQRQETEVERRMKQRCEIVSDNDVTVVARKINVLLGAGYWITHYVVDDGWHTAVCILTKEVLKSDDDAKHYFTEYEYYSLHN